MIYLEVIVVYDNTNRFSKPIKLSSLSDEQLAIELNKGIDDLYNGRILSAKEFEDSFYKDYEI